ncbi:EamA family transporter [Guptibacillus hwajinpoensis]|uniref:Multidrug DMT transporter permease n=1 Tax=Guptibacillus hwajinpoensis TaxID=208199 RepID=A0A0J6CXU5_9BACL|nr:DMT family transporter [Alkalihalobacillus macyae]KMM38000.1 multidrug DMT transporter permease [Alkalihalobacillus macyae]
MKIKGIIFVLLGAGSFGFTPVFVKTGFGYGYSLGQINIAQMVLAFILLSSLSLILGLKVKNLSKSDYIKIMITGTAMGLTSVFYYGAMLYLSASLAIILLFQFVWIGMIYEWVFSKVKPTRVNVLSLLVTLTGVVFASNLIAGDASAFHPIGLLLGFLAGASYAGFIFFSGQVATRSHPIVRSVLMVAGSMVLVLVVFVRDIPTIPITDGRMWILGTGLALVGGVIPTLFFAKGAPLITGRLANVLSSIELPVAIISAMIVLSESVSFLQWVGVLLIVVAIIINELGCMMKGKAVSDQG